MMRLIFSFIAIIGISHASVYGQGKPLVIEKINDKIYLFTTYNTYNGVKISANGLYMLTKKGAILFDTPWDATQYQPLLDSIQEKHQMSVIGVFASHWHEDRAGGFAYYNAKKFRPTQPS